MKKTKKLLSFFLAIVMVITAIPAFTLTASAATTDVTKSNNENSVTNRILIDNAIYTYASESAYYNYGTTISTTDSWSTKIYFRNGASSTNLKSITCLDDGSRLSVENNTLKGNFTDNKFKVSGATDVNATLLFTFNDGTKEYHRVAVKSYPVENHIACEAIKIGSFNSRTESGYTMFMRDSTGAGGLGVWQYQKSYAKSGTGTHGLDNAAILTADKKAYNKGYSEGGNAEPTQIGTATYYIDKSCHGTSWEGLGNSELWNGTNYVVPIEVIRTKFFHDNGGKWNFDLNNMPVQNKLVRTTNASLGNKNDNGTTYGLSFTHNASVNESNRYTSCNDTACNIRIGVRTTDKGYALLKTNLIVKLFDKSTARDKYDEFINKNLVESNYTASSFATYQNALLAMEAYLSNYEDTTEADILSDVYINLERAYNNLVPRGDTQAVLNKLAEFQSVATEQSNSNKYTTTSYNNFVNEQILNPSDELTAAINLKTDTLAQRELTAALSNTYINTIQHYLDILVECADFSTLASNYTSAQSKIADESSYTKSSFDAFKTVVDNAVYAKYSDAAKKDTKKSTAQSAIDSESTAIANAIAALVQRANFTYYDSCVSDAADALSVLTAKDGQNIRVYRLLEPYEPITLYTDNEKEETPITSQTTVNNKGTEIANANTNINNSTVPGTDYVDQSALTSFTTEFANFDTDVYTESVVNAKLAEAAGLYKSITFNSNTYWSLNVADQADLDNKLTSYLNAINDSINTYNVTVPSAVTATASYAATPTDNGDGTKTYAYPLGTAVTFTNGDADTAWYMSVQSNNTTRGNQYQAYGKAFTTKVVGNLTITAEYAVADSTPYYVAIIREYDNAGSGKAIDRVNYVANNSTYTLPTPTKIANYNFVEYVVNGVTKAAGDVITITADTEITAKYQYIGSNLTITVNGTAKTYAYNESVTVSASGAYAWVEKTGDTWRPFYIGSAVTFRATESTELKSVATEAEMKQYCGTKEAYAPNLRLNGVLVDADNRAVFHAQRIDYLPTGAQIVEFGILMNTASSTDFDLENDNVKNAKTVRMKSTQSLDKVQFNIFAKNAGDKPFTYRSYMIYKLADGTVKTVYSDVITKA